MPLLIEFCHTKSTCIGHSDWCSSFEASTPLQRRERAESRETTARNVESEAKKEGSNKSREQNPLFSQQQLSCPLLFFAQADWHTHTRALVRAYVQDDFINVDRLALGVLALGQALLRVDRHHHRRTAAPSAASTCARGASPRRSRLGFVRARSPRGCHQSRHCARAKEASTRMNGCREERAKRNGAETREESAGTGSVRRQDAT